MRHLALLTLLLIAACARDSRNQYDDSEVGRSRIVEFGTVITAREIDVTGHNSGVTSLLGGAAGGGAGSYLGKGSGSIWTAASGAVLGAVAGGLAEQAISNHKGIEYTVTVQNGRTITLVQNEVEGEPMLAPGSRVIVQTSGSYQRILPAANMPTQIDKPQGITFNR